MNTFPENARCFRDDDIIDFVRVFVAGAVVPGPRPCPGGRAGHGTGDCVETDMHLNHPI